MSDTAARPSREERILGIIETARGKQSKFKDERITMSHGAGGKASQSLIEGLLLPAFDNEALGKLGDAGAVTVDGVRLAMTTDSFVVRPIRFPGGSIGELAVNGTVNDLAVSGARPLAREPRARARGGPAGRGAARRGRGGGARCRGGRRADRDRRHQGRRARPRRQDVRLHDRRGGAIDPRAELSTAGLRPGDRIIVSGPIGEHGSAIMLARDEFELEAEIESDTQPLWPAVDALLEEAGPALHAMRDATRGGVASALNELARASNVAMLVSEAAVPVKPEVAGAAELLGIDPMYVANEGRLVAFVAPERADAALAALRSVPGSEEAAEIGEVRTEPPGMVLVDTAFGGRRVMDLLAGDPLPRIC